MVSFTIIHAIEHKTNRQDGRLVRDADLWASVTTYTKYSFPYFENLHMVSSTIIHAIEHKIYRQDDRVVTGA